MGDNSKHKAVVWMKEPLMEKRSGIQNSKVGTPLDVGDNFRLEGQGVGVRENHVVELLYVDHYFVFSFALRIKLSNDKDKKTEWGLPRREFKAAKAMHLVKRLVNKLASFVSQEVDPRLDGGYLCLPARLEWHFHLAFRWYPDKSFTDSQIDRYLATS